MILFFILLWGLFAGWLANAVTGGGIFPRHWKRLAVTGLAGSFAGGLLAGLLAGDGLRLRPSGLIGSVVGAIVILVAIHAFTGLLTSDAVSDKGRARPSGKSNARR